MWYVDFNSLYPSVNYYTEYPIGHPERKFWNQEVNWTKPIHMFRQLDSDQGLFKVFITPPQNTIIPVLPAKFDNRLLFPLCIRCALSYDHKTDEDDVDYFAAVKNCKRHNIKCDDYTCPHSDEERGWVGTYTHLELQRALSRGYKVKHLIWSWQWKVWSRYLFRDYIKTFYKIKTESSWNENRPVTERDALIKSFKEKYQIDLDPEKMKLNEGMRYIAKLCLNSMWGKFCKNFKVSFKKFFRSMVSAEQPYKDSGDK